MRFWKKRPRPRPAPPAFRRLGLERLEDRSMLSAISVVAGHPSTFYDSDGTRVLIALTGPGQASYTLASAAQGGGIGTLTLTGTNNRSTLTITTVGGTVAGTTIDDVVIDAAAGQNVALNDFSALQVDLIAGGQVQADGVVTDLQLRNVGASAQIDVTGDLGMNIQSLGAGASVDVSGNLKQFNTRTIASGSQISAQQIAWLNVTTQAQGATINAGTGGIQSLIFGNLDDTVVTSVGNIASTQINGTMQQSSIVCNMLAGSDGTFGTIDDSVESASSSGQIGSVQVAGSLGSDPSDDLFEASGTIGTVQVAGTNASTLASPPTIWQQATSNDIPLDVTQEIADATGYPDSQIWVAVYGQVIKIPGPGQVPHVEPSYYLDASDLSPTNVPILEPTSALYALPSTPDEPILPSSTLAQWGSNLALPVPAAGMQFTGRILISVGAPVQAQVNLSNGTVSAPNAADPTDPSNGTFYDFLEFTVTNNAGVPNLDVDTSQVDSYGLPLQLQFFENSAGTEAYTFAITGSTQKGSETVTNIPDTSQLAQGYPLTGAGLPQGATIQSIVNSTSKTPGSVTLNIAATATATSIPLWAEGAGPVGVQAERQAIIDGSSTDDLVNFVEAQVAAGNTAASAFFQSAAPYQTIGPLPISSTTSTGTITVNTESTADMQDGDTVVVSGVVGTTSANGVWKVAAVTPTSFQLVGPNGNGAYQSGGTWSFAITGATNPGAGKPIVVTTSSTDGMQNGDIVEVSNVAGNTAANGFFIVSGVTATSFTLNNSNGAGNAYAGSGGTWSVYTPSSRIVSPKDIVEAITNPADTDPLNNYFNAAVDQFFLQYFTGTVNGVKGGGQTLQLVSQASGTPITYDGTVTNVGTANGDYALQLTDPTGTDPHTYDIYYPFFTTNLPATSVYKPIFTVGTPPSWIQNAGQETESASQMIFACDAVFADNVAQGLTGSASAVLGDLENSVSAALNRGIALLPASQWGNSSDWFLQTGGQNGYFNYWVDFWHSNHLTISNLAYAFPYDDKYGASTNLSQNNVGLAKITLGTWSTLQHPSTTEFENFPISATQQGQVTLTAQIVPTQGQPTATGTVTFYIDGVPINSQNDSASPQLQPVTLNASGVATITALLPALSDGSVTHTYTVTAVYSGDGHNAPSIAYNSLQVVGSAGDFEVVATPGAGKVGSQTTITADLPGGSPTGTVTISIAHQNGTGSQVLATITPTSSTVTQPVTIPSSLLTFTGDTTKTSDTITNVSSLVNLVPGQTVTASGTFAAGTTITSFTPATLQLSQPAQQTGTYTFTADGVTFQGTTAKNSNQMVGVISLTGLANGDTITGYGIQSGTTLSILTTPSVLLDNPASNKTSGTTFTSNAASSAFPIEVVYKPTSGPSYTASTVFAVT